MKPIKDILVRPLLSEKTTALRGLSNQYAFEVTVSANKIEIKKAVEARFQVKVQSVQTLNVIGKVKRTRGIEGRRANWKKALVRLREGDTIKELE